MPSFTIHLMAAVAAAVPAGPGHGGAGQQVHDGVLMKKYGRGGGVCRSERVVQHTCLPAAAASRARQVLADVASRSRQVRLRWWWWWCALPPPCPFPPHPLALLASMTCLLATGSSHLLTCIYAHCFEQAGCHQGMAQPASHVGRDGGQLVWKVVLRDRARESSGQVELMQAGCQASNG